MATTYSAMIKDLGATGFIGFDYMIAAETGDSFLLECNPRPIQVCHLGNRIGVDLCAALAAGMAGQLVPLGVPSKAEVIALFPQDWRREHVSVYAEAIFIDVPWDDRALVKHMVACA